MSMNLSPHIPTGYIPLICTTTVSFKHLHAMCADLMAIVLMIAADSMPSALCAQTAEPNSDGNVYNMQG